MATHSRMPCLEKPMDRGAWWASYNPWGRKESDTTEQLTLPLSNTQSPHQDARASEPRSPSLPTLPHLGCCCSLDPAHFSLRNPQATSPDGGLADPRSPPGTFPDGTGYTASAPHSLGLLPHSQHEARQTRISVRWNIWGSGRGGPSVRE